jgi:hypothetical protein
VLEAIIRIITAPIIDPLEAIVASVEQLQEQITDVKDSLTAAIGRVEEDVENLKNQSGGIDPADLDPISQGLSDLKTNLDALDPDPSNPPTDPNPDPTPTP